MLAITGTGLITSPDFATKKLVSERKLYKIGTFKDITEDYLLIYGYRHIENPAVKYLLKNFNPKL